ARDGEGRPLVWDREREAAVPHATPRRVPAMQGSFTLPDGRRVRPAFELVANRILDEAHAPETVEARTGVPAATIRRIAFELAAAAFDESRSLEQPWQDAWGRKHDRMVSRP